MLEISTTKNTTSNRMSARGTPASIGKRRQHDRRRAAQAAPGDEQAGSPIETSEGRKAKEDPDGPGDQQQDRGDLQPRQRDPQQPGGEHQQPERQEHGYLSEPGRGVVEPCETRLRGE
jgi:hypothetical protein